MKLKEAAVGTIVQPGTGWDLFKFPGEERFPGRLEVVENHGESVVCRPVGGGLSMSFYGELEVGR